MASDTAPDTMDPLDSGRRALEAGDWASARDSFHAALEHEETGDALFGLGDALWWLGETETSVRYQARAYGRFRRDAQPESAALAGIALFLSYRVSLGNYATARGWMARVASLVEEFDLTDLRGWVLLMRAQESQADLPAAERLAREARDLARKRGDLDLELCALSQLGTALVDMGRIEEGIELLDESMAGSLGGEGKSLDTVVYTSCNMITSCCRAADFERAAQWIRASDDFTDRFGSPYLYTKCRTFYAHVLLATGKWTEAEDELRIAIEMARTAEPAVHAQAVVKLAELRVAQGRIGEAEKLIEGVEQHPAATGVCAAIHLIHGRSAAARSVLLRRLDEIGRDNLEAGLLLELLAGAEVANGATSDAAETARHAIEIGARSGCEVIVAQGERATGRTLIAAGDPQGAVPHLERGLRSFTKLQMTLDVGRSHLLLAEALQAHDREAAVREGRSALTLFEGLGAGRDADAVGALLRGLGVKAARRSEHVGGSLTKREREVLGLLGEGLSNRAIAERLFLSHKTIEHHVANVLSKLGLRSRAEAAAYSVRHLEQNPGTN